MRYQTRPARIQFFYFVVASALLANVCVPAFLSDAWPRDSAMFLRLMAGGALCAEVCLLAIWAALGPQPVIYRVPLAFSLLVLAVCAFLVGLQMRDQPQTQEPDSAVGLAIVAVVMFTAVQIPFLFVRARDHKRIASPDTRFLTPAEDSLQFGLRYLLGWMTGVGLLLAIVRYSVPGTVDRHTSCS